ncbi:MULTISPECIES: Asp23/Gls24 family envelope stress response protein [Clostridium]|uniref:Asp23/Gls24 family envelope stress response protein n=2 Tax=Clostridium cadaveris TaxID=1529 RepID=A0A1I2J5I8_9CLOT|nr:Asp23/Gls24 family envelope stress response protein [Clostridium cadaveris]MDU4953581.1 Asp23/Gls24 family envelope stress response protein [Clostridium sp.]MDM8313198.1 Asp23/Gls24 family envelope stress response protein [Clostridium cadaveris]NME63158.1 Asp23/Gls24 family envelope stress response protein [Clostridium cadaveris]NWK10304.1 Asp23/Gls24 family envelope stress response protein [Clostridium cadaveris]PWL53603.1 MAG: Asp23/Gls24 family envelope stress response protein [Clostridi
MNEVKKEDSNIGIVKISDDVVSVIASIATSEITGVASTDAGMVGSIAHMVTGKKSNTKGVKVAVGEKDASIDIAIAVEYGIKIPEIVSQVQDNVKKTVETMTGLSVAAVNVYVQSIILKKPSQNNPETK